MVEDTDSTFRKLFKGGVFVLVGLVFELGLSFFAKLLMARVLPKVDYGFVSVGVTVLNVAVAFSLLGIHAGVGRYLPRSEDVNYRKGVILSGLQIVFPAVILTSLFSYISANELAALVFNDPGVAPVIQTFALAIPFFAAVKFAVGTMQGAKTTAPKVVIQNLVVPGSRFLFVFGALYFGLSSLGVSYAYVGSYALGALVGGMYLVRKTTILEGGTATQMRRELVIFSAPLFAMKALGLVFSDLDTFMIGYFATATDIADYHVVYPISQLLTTFIGAFSFLFLPILSELHSESRGPEMARVYQVVTKWVFISTFPLFLVITFFPDWVIQWTFGARYTPASFALSILSVGFFIHAVAGLNVGALTSIGKTRVIMYDNLVVAVINFGLNLLLIPRFGIFGAAVATAIAYTSLNILYSVQLYLETGIQPLSSGLLRPAIVSGLLFAMVYVLIKTIIPNTLLMMVLILGLFFIVYTGTVVRYGGIEEEEIMIVGSIEDRFGIDLGFLRRVANQIKQE